VLRYLSFVELANASMCGAWVARNFWRVLKTGNRRPVLRLLFARPLWWLAVRLLSVPDAQARYARFSADVLAKWEDTLLGR
jgi:hypothetical protein